MKEWAGGKNEDLSDSGSEGSCGTGIGTHATQEIQQSKGGSETHGDTDTLNTISKVGSGDEILDAHTICEDTLVNGEHVIKQQNAKTSNGYTSSKNNLKQTKNKKINKDISE